MRQFLDRLLKTKKRQPELSAALHVNFLSDPANKVSPRKRKVAFKVSTTVAAAIVTVHPGGLREIHWHQNADEWQYYMSGSARMTVVGTGERARTMDFQAGDVGYIEKTLPHYIQNMGDDDLRFLELFRSSRFEDLSLSEWLAHTPPELVMAHLNIDKATYDRVPREKPVVLPR